MATRLPEPGAPEVLYVVDLSGFAFRAYHALPPMSSSKGEPTHVVLGVTQMLLDLVKERRPALLAVAIDPPGPSFRKGIYEGYKASRPAAPPDLRQQLDRLEEVVAAYGVPVLGVPGFEADDVIATLVTRARAAGHPVVVVSADKDLLQLVRDGSVWMLDSSRGRVYGEAETIDKLGVGPRQVRDLLSLTGDSSDDVPGVPSVGPKTAAKLLAQFPDLDAIYAGLEQVERAKLREKLEAHRDQAFLSRQLVTLRDDVPIDFEPDQLTYGGADTEALRALFAELELHRLLARLPAAAPRPPPEVSVVGEVAALEAIAAEARRVGRLAIHTLAEGDDARHASIVGVALALEPGECAYVPSGHLYADAPTQLPAAEVVRVLGPLLESSEVELIVADSKRERLLWARRGAKLSRVGFDTMLASYLVDPERHGHSLEEVARAERDETLEGYDGLTEKRRGYQKALSDVEVERAAEFASARVALILDSPDLFGPRLAARELESLLHDVELPLAEVLAEMEERGVRVDAPTLRRQSEQARARMETLEAEAERAVGHPFKIGSPRALETILFDELGLPVIKKTKTARSTDHEVLEALASEHPLPRLILEHRLLAKLASTYLDALPEQIDPRTGRVHTRFNQAVAATGRMSSSEPNLQNIPIRTEEGRAIREAFIAREGFSLLSADYSQVELRVLAHLSRDAELIEAFVHDEDVHDRTARALFGVEGEAITREMRGRAKTVNYAVIYGQTQFALAKNLEITKTEAKRYIDAFFERYAGVAAYFEGLLEEARRTGGVRTLLGRWRSLPDIRSRNPRLRSAAERVACNTPIQGTAADLMKIAMVRVAERIRAERLESQMILTVHDELLFELAPGEEAAMRALVREEMENAIPLDVPLIADIGIGPTWADAH